jgi:hypothetical protein
MINKSIVSFAATALLFSFASSAGSVTHNAHDFGVFANVSIGYAFDL